MIMIVTTMMEMMVINVDDDDLRQDHWSVETQTKRDSKIEREIFAKAMPPPHWSAILHYSKTLCLKHIDFFCKMCSQMEGNVQ